MKKRQRGIMDESVSAEEKAPEGRHGKIRNIDIGKIGDGRKRLAGRGFGGTHGLNGRGNRVFRRKRGGLRMALSPFFKNKSASGAFERTFLAVESAVRAFHAYILTFCRVRGY